MDVIGRQGWRARYVKEVDADETTLRFWQEICDEQGVLVERHEKIPVDKGHRRVSNGIMTVDRQTVATKIAAYLRHQISLAELVDWAEQAMLVGDFPAADSAVVSKVVARLGVADVRAFGLTWEDCEQALRDLGFAAHIEIVHT